MKRIHMKYCFPDRRGSSRTARAEFIAVVILFILTVSWQCFGSEPGLKKVALMPQWLPQAQFAGYMVALDKGFYRESGLDVTLMRGGPSEPSMEAVRSGRATFCTSWLSTGIQQRAAGNPILNVGQIIQRSALMLISKKATKIDSPKDFEGKKIAIWEGDFRIQPLAFFRMNRLTTNVVPMYGTINLFLKGGVDAISGMWYNEYHTLLNSGLDSDELSLFFFRDDPALDFPEDGIYCLEKTYQDDPQSCAKFVQASLKGWLYAFEHTDEALDIVMKYTDEANVGTNRAHQKWMLARMRDLIMPTGSEADLGKLAPKNYSRVGEVLRDLGFIGMVPPFDDFYRGPK
ncbi:MAG: ABC transporter substrate-binding protein [Desulfomonile tiedjei]|uniref:Thiamine pyrimidine synthase n=1 Tax=Desulfomonile tiedjei TaxID=2358 RepID=A0A9D6Z0G6_9BACT|nr:ABC transporter substrate-binding protein [Desulfomonile tiedjei]